MTTSTIDRANAAFQEQVHAQWRDWRAYLSAHLTLLEAQSADRQTAFERTDALEEQAAEAQRRLAALPLGQRALFDSQREVRRQQAQVNAEGAAGSESPRLPDPDVLERQVLTELLAEAEGTAEGAGRTHGWGEVPLQADGDVQWYRVNVESLRDAPTAAAYAVRQRQGDDMRRRFALAGLMVAATILFLLAWFLWPRGGSKVVQDEPRGLIANGAPVDVWPARSVELLAASGTSTTVTLTETRLLSWPSALGAAGAWRSTAIAPLVLCVPSPALDTAATARLRGGADVPERVFALFTSPGLVVDLRVEPCPGERDDSKVWFGVLQSTDAQGIAAFGEPVVLGDGTPVTVFPPLLLGPGQDPTLPPDTARLVMRLEAPALDWPAYAPTLLLASGETLAAPEVVTRPDGVELRYLIPLPSSELDVSWSLTPPGSESRVRWRATLAPPPSRVTIIQNALAVQGVTVRESDQERILEIVVRNQGQTTLLLTRDDLVLTRGTERVPVPDLAPLQAALDAGETRTLAIPLSAETLSSPLVLTLGAARFEIARP